MIDKHWTIVEAQYLLRRLEEALGGKYHVGLLGSVLLDGMSNKDLDIVVYPRDASVHFNRREHVLITTALTKVGLHRVADFDSVKEEWRKKGSKDCKNVEVWRTEGKRRVDVFYLR